MNLYQINRQIEDILNTFEIDDETGEILNTDNVAQLMQLQMDKDIKIENVALFIKNMSALIIALKDEKRSFEQRIKVAENKIDNAKKYLVDATGGEKFSSSKCQISFRNTKAIDISDEDLIPDAYKIIKTEKRVDKRAVKMAFDEMIDVPGASIVERKSVIIR